MHLHVMLGGYTVTVPSLPGCISQAQLSVDDFLALV